MTEPNRFRIEDPVLALVGPTAVGKTDLSISLAQHFNCEIISVDSMQVYRYMDIGTAKASQKERRLIAHHLIDIVDPDEDYHAARFVDDCLEAITAILQRGAIPLLTGGTGLYLQALKQGLFSAPATDSELRDRLTRRIEEEGSHVLHNELTEHDPESSRRIHPNDRSRIVRALEVYLSTGIALSEHLKRQESGNDGIDFSTFITVGITCERDELYDRINHRTESLFDLGLEAEVRSLLDRGYDPHLKSMQSIGYRHMQHYINGDCSLEQCRELLARDTRRYAKRQYTWFSKDHSICWVDRKNKSAVLSYIVSKLGHNHV